jgi:hypothetical protein
MSDIVTHQGKLNDESDDIRHDAETERDPTPFLRIIG